MSARSELAAVDTADKSVGRAKAIVGTIRDCMGDDDKQKPLNIDALELHALFCMLYDL